MGDYKKSPIQELGSCQEIFQAINERQVTALMFHDQMADFFDFLNLQGFKRIHEYQFLEESLGHRKLSRYYLSHHNHVLPSSHVSDPKVIPQDWGGYTRFSVTPPVRKQAVEKAFDDYKEWEDGTLKLYSSVAKTLLEWGEISDFNQVNALIQDVSLEIKYLDRMILRLQSISYDALQIDAMQQEIHDCYKKKIRELTPDL